jgi:cytochrome c556
MRKLFVALPLALASCGPPTNNTPVEGIPKIKTLEEVMDAQATAADPQFAKREQASFTDAEFAAFADTGAKIDATSKRIKDFTKGPEFDALASKLGENAAALSKAAAAKDPAGSRAALVAMKATCGECHSKFR